MNAFSGCTALTELTLPDSVTDIGTQCFEGCTALERILFSGDLESVGEDAFKDTAIMAEFLASSQNELIFGGFLLAVKQMPESYTLPAGIVGIGGAALKGQVTQVILPAGVKYVGRYAFSGCEGLKSVTLPEGVVDLGFSAFAGCALEQIVLPQSLERIEFDTFRNCKSLKLADVSGVKIIGMSAFEGCESLETVLFGKELEEIGGGAFEGCTSLAVITLPDSLKRVGSSAFRNTAAYNDPQNQEGKLIYLGNWLIACTAYWTDITVREGTVGIAGGVGYRAQSVFIPASVRYLSNSALQDLARSQCTFEDPKGWLVGVNSSSTDPFVCDLDDPDVHWSIVTAYAAEKQ